jgi:hypothetical protein
MSARVAAATDPSEHARLQHQLDLYKGIRSFDTPVRDYDAVELSLTRKFAPGLYVNASYTYSRANGNYPGSVSYDNGQIDPNISSEYDLVELLANRRGALPQDRPHSLKLDGYYTYKVNDQSAFTIGTRARAISGIPENALAGHYLYGPNESFLLPRGTLGRTDFEHAVDLHVAYKRHISRTTSAELYVDVFNVYNNQGTFNVDTTYADRTQSELRQHGIALRTDVGADRVPADFLTSLERDRPQEVGRDVAGEVRVIAAQPAAGDR